MYGVPASRPLARRAARAAARQRAAPATRVHRHLLARVARARRPRHGQARGGHAGEPAADGQAAPRGRAARPADEPAPGLRRPARHRQDDRRPAVRPDPRRARGAARPARWSRSPAPTWSAAVRRRHRDQDDGEVQPRRWAGCCSSTRRTRSLRPGARPRLRPGGDRHPGQADGGPPRRRRGDRRRLHRARCGSSWPSNPGLASRFTRTIEFDELHRRRAGDHRRALLPDPPLHAGVRHPRGARRATSPRCRATSTSATPGPPARSSRRWSTGRPSGCADGADVPHEEHDPAAARGPRRPPPRRRRRRRRRQRRPGDPAGRSWTRMVGLPAVKREVTDLVNLLAVGPAAPAGRPAGAAGVPAPGLLRPARHRQDDRRPAVRAAARRAGRARHGQLIEVGRADLVGEYIGHTARRTTRRVRPGPRRCAVHRRGVHAGPQPAPAAATSARRRSTRWSS